MLIFKRKASKTIEWEFCVILDVAYGQEGTSLKLLFGEADTYG